MLGCETQKYVVEATWPQYGVPHNLIEPQSPGILCCCPKKHRTLRNEYAFHFAFAEDWPADANMQADRHFGEDVVLELPLVRFFTWDKPSISFGCNQNPRKRLDLALCRDDGIPVVRRPTGGRELLHGHDICYCVTMPVSSSISGISAKVIFGEVNDVLVLGLKKLGIAAEWSNFANRPTTTSGPCFAQIDTGEIMIGGRKLVASAQRVYPRSIIQQGSIPLDEPEIELLKYLRLGDKLLMTKRSGEMTAYLKDHLNGTTTVALIVDVFRGAFEENFGRCSKLADGIYDDFRKEYFGK